MNKIVIAAASVITPCAGAMSALAANAGRSSNRHFVRLRGYLMVRWRRKPRSARQPGLFPHGIELTPQTN
jgi:hypothetical protein